MTDNVNEEQNSEGDNIVFDNLTYDSSLDPPPKQIFELPGELVIVKNAKVNFQHSLDNFLQDEVAFEPKPKRTFKL